MSSLNFQQLLIPTKTGKHRFLSPNLHLPVTSRGIFSIQRGSPTPGNPETACLRHLQPGHHPPKHWDMSDSMETVESYNMSLWSNCVERGIWQGDISGSKAQQVVSSKKGCYMYTVTSKFEGILLYHLLMIVDGQ